MTVKLYEVGGYVRDSLLGIQSKDVDFAVECAKGWGGMLRWLNDQGFKVFLETPEYLTARAQFPRDWVDDHPWLRQGKNGVMTADFVLCRKEGEYTDGRRPDEVEPGTLEDDLARRDFTVNAIARDFETRELIDPHEGVYDLEDMRLRCVGSAEERFTEDALRILRALRFKITRGFGWDNDIARAWTSRWLPPLLASVSTERVREELTPCFKTDTLKTLRLIGVGHGTPAMREAIFRDGLWLKPTMEG